MTTTKLTATLQKDYYGKAHILIDDNYIILKSYDTLVLAIHRKTNNLVRLWSGWSSTTAKHINDFLLQNGFNRINKKEWLNMPCYNTDETFNECETTISRLYNSRPNCRAWYE